MRFGKKVVVIMLFLLLLGLTYLISGWFTCSEPEIWNVSDTDKPDFVVQVWPLPRSKINTICYIRSYTDNPISIGGRGIGVFIDTEYLVDLETFHKDENIKQPFKERVFLYLDGEKVPNTSRSVYDDLVGMGKIEDGNINIIPDISKGYAFSWAPPTLWPGNHTAKIMIQTKSGKILEYQWVFSVW